MSSAVCLVVTYALNAVWEVPLMAGAGWLASRITQRRGPRAQHVVWVATLLLGVLVPALPMGRAVLSAGMSAVGNGTAVSAIVPGEGARAGAMQAGSLLLPAWTIGCVFAAYAGTVLLFAARLLRMLAGARALRRGSTPLVPSGEACAWWERVRRPFGLRDAAILASDSVRGVVTVGARKPAIVAPTGFLEQCEENEWLTALGHELAHIERRDYAKNLLYEAASVMVAFHPVTWMVKARMVETREMVCDAMVVERLVEARHYRQSLLRLAERMLGTRTAGVHAVGIFDGNVLERRITIMKTKRTVLGNGSRSARSGGAVLLLLAALVVGAAFAKGVAARAADHDEQPYGTVYHPGGDVSAPRLVVAPNPEYPEAERKAVGFEHVVCVVGVIVDRDGMPQEVHVVRSGGKDFDANALAAVRQYRFKPGVRFGSPVAVAIHIEVNFRKY